MGDERRRRAQGRGRPPLRAAAVVLLRARRPRPPGRARAARRSTTAHAHRARAPTCARCSTRPPPPAPRSRSPTTRRLRPRRRARSRSRPFYTPLTGTSMAAPALTGAVAVMQSAAKARLGRFLTPAEVEGIVTRNADPMTRDRRALRLPLRHPRLPDVRRHPRRPRLHRPAATRSGRSARATSTSPGAVAPRSRRSRAPTGAAVRRGPAGGVLRGPRRPAHRPALRRGEGCAGAGFGLRPGGGHRLRRACARCAWRWRAAPGGAAASRTPPGGSAACGPAAPRAATCAPPAARAGRSRSGAALKPGRYLVWARAADTKGNASRPGRALALRVR